MDTVKHKFSWLRLVAAIFVAFVASFVWYMVLYQWYFGFVGAYWCNVLIGFLGVSVGTLCFRRQHRFLGSVILLVGGVALDGMFEDSDDKVYPLSVCWVALGGLAAVGFYYWRRPPNPQGGANGTQPLRPDSNPEPAAVASRRSP
jgi:hypothetical protein